MDRETLHNYSYTHRFSWRPAYSQKVTTISSEIDSLSVADREAHRRGVRLDATTAARDIMRIYPDGIIGLGDNGNYHLSIEDDNDVYGDLTADKCVMLRRTDIVVPGDEDATKQAQIIVNLHGVFNSISTPELVDMHETIDTLRQLIIEQPA